MTAADRPSWTDYGPAEFDARLMPKGAHKPDPGQSPLFVIAVPPKPRKAVPAPEILPGQEPLFADGEL